jgi:hypothetical protein
MLALWVRSYWRADVVVGPIYGHYVFSISSGYGALLFRNYQAPKGTTWDWGINSSIVDESDLDARERIGSVTTLGFRVIDWRPIGWAVIVPHSFFVLLFGLSAAAPWIPWSKRFRIRTLLIAIALAAIVLGTLAISN